jgi:hypothetical protein
VTVADPVLERLEDQIGWYDRKSGQAQRRFKWLKGLQLATAAAIPVTATTGVHAGVLAAQGAAIVMIEGFLQPTSTSRTGVRIDRPLRHSSMRSTSSSAEQGHTRAPSSRGGCWPIASKG